jgi:hypothetical protein
VLLTPIALQSIPGGRLRPDKVFACHPIEEAAGGIFLSCIAPIVHAIRANGIEGVGAILFQPVEGGPGSDLSKQLAGSCSPCFRERK